MWSAYSCLLLLLGCSCRISQSFVLFPNNRVTNTAVRTREANVKSTKVQLKQSNHRCNEEELLERRRAMEFLGASFVGLTTAVTSFTPDAYASGGATAGGAYLLSAKQRYNKRVTAGITSFLALEKSLEGGSFDTTKGFFSGEDEGSWKDVAAAGYLLANAFRRNSTASPDSLPSVQKWKAFAADVASLEKLSKKGKDPAAGLAAWKKAESSLDAYLDAVELPSVAEMK